MKFSQYGSNNGQKIIYFHGAPGAPEESAIFDQCAKENGLTIICFDRFSIDPTINGEAYYQNIANEVVKIAAGEKVDLVGFSIGAFIALQTSRYLGSNIRSLHLISAAVPLNAGNFIDTMAGKRVFQLAKNFPALFTLLSYWQGLLAQFFSEALFRLLFAGAKGADKELANKSAFQSSITQVLISCFTGYAHDYIRDLKAYVQPWSKSLSEASANTYTWHGAEDNWSPVIMAKYLVSAIQNCTDIEILEGLSHYSCLYEVAPTICKRLSNSINS